jgi:hypothetical protein
MFFAKKAIHLSMNFTNSFGFVFAASLPFEYPIMNGGPAVTQRIGGTSVLWGDEEYFAHRRL